MVLYEKVSEIKKFERFSFCIYVTKSDLSQSQTFQHALENKNLVFNAITYKLKSNGKNQTELSLNCDYNIRTNVPVYGELLSKSIIADFEQKLLKALKKQHEKAEGNNIFIAKIK